MIMLGGHVLDDCVHVGTMIIALFMNAGCTLRSLDGHRLGYKNTVILHS